jgi:hypothetical protein
MMRLTIVHMALLGAGVAVPALAQLSPATPDRNPPTAPVQESTRPAAPAPVPNAASGANMPGTTVPGVTVPGERTGLAAPNRSAEGGGQAATPANAPQPGANSFTEAQARSRIEAAGFSDVSALHKDDQGIWRGRAIRNGKQVGVAMDFRGNVSAQ